MSCLKEWKPLEPQSPNPTSLVTLRWQLNGGTSEELLEERFWLKLVASWSILDGGVNREVFPPKCLGFPFYKHVLVFTCGLIYFPHFHIAL